MEESREMEKKMKKILSTAVLVAATSVMLGATAFGACPLRTIGTAPAACQMGTPTGAAAPVSYIVAPVAQRTYVPPCNNCANQPAKKSIFQKVMTPFTGVYNAVFGPFTNLYD